MRMCTGWLSVSVLTALGAVPAWGRAPKPDIKVTTLTVTRVTTSAVPLRVRVHVSATNVGSAPIRGQYVTRVSYKKSGTSVWTDLKDQPCANGGINFSSDFDIDEGGTLTFKAQADVDNTIDEVSNGNNSKTTTVHLESGEPDLVISDLTATVLQTLSNGNLRVKVTFDVENTGDGKATKSSQCSIKIQRGSGSYALAGSASAAPLAAGAKRQVTRTYTIVSSASFRVRVNADVNNVIAEKHEGNNQADSERVVP